MQKPRSIKDLLSLGGKRLGALKNRSDERSAILEHVCRVLPPDLVGRVLTAGIDNGRLTLGVSSAAWASRLRYQTTLIAKAVSLSLGVEIHTVRVRVMPPS